MIIAEITANLAILTYQLSMQSAFLLLSLYIISVNGVDFFLFEFHRS